MVQEAPTGTWTVSGPSGAGKTTLIKALLEYFPQAKPLLRVTTREERSTDIKGEYEYPSLEQFWTYEREGRFITVVGVHNYYHATPFVELDRALTNERLTFADVSPDVAEKYVQYATKKGRPELINSLYLDLSDENEIRRRLTERGQYDIEGRIHACREWAQYVAHSPAHFHIIDARASEEEVLRQALQYLVRL